MQIPISEHPEFVTQAAIERGVENKLLFTTWGGLGDQLCAEPTLAFAVKEFRRSGMTISLSSEFPEMFAHIPFDEVFDSKKVRPIWDNYLVLHTIKNPETMLWQFVSHCVTHCVDFPTICSLRSTLPIEWKAVRSEPERFISKEFMNTHKFMTNKEHVFVHAGKHWPSKTFPSTWWNCVLEEIKLQGFMPIIIGKDLDDNRGTVDVDTTGCIDLRNKTSLSETMWLLKNCKALISNDSSPLHMAAIGNAHIAFVASAKHQDYIYHWRRPHTGNGISTKVEWAWRMRHFNRGGIWDDINHCPNKKEQVTVDQVEADKVASWLPDPDEMPKWVKSCL